MAALHRFTCEDCGAGMEAVMPKSMHHCPKCHGEMYLSSGGASIHGNYQRPIHSDALAIHPDQRAEHEQKFPNIRLDEQNRPVFDNMYDHQKYLDECGLVKRTQKIRHKIGTVTEVWPEV